MRSARRLLAPALVLALLSALAGCFEPPVKESVLLVFDAQGRVEARVDTEIASERDYERNARARARIAEARDGVRCGEDSWTMQLARLSPTSFARTTHERDGALRSVLRTARFDDPRGVERLFDSLPLAVTRVENAMQLEIVPGTPGRATASERREALDGLDRFAAAGARYLRALGETWLWLDTHPERERDVLVELLGEGEGYEPADEREAALVKEAEEAMGEVMGFLHLEEGRGESLEEISRKAFDPFPAPLAVEVAGRVEESTGFAAEGERRFRVPPVSLHGALAALSGRWVSPDPVAAIGEAAARGGDAKPDVERFLATARHARATPAPADLRAALEKALVPQPVYRLRWRLPAAAR